MHMLLKSFFFSKSVLRVRRLVVISNGSDLEPLFRADLFHPVFLFSKSVRPSNAPPGVVERFAVAN